MRIFAPPSMSLRFVPVWRRNLLVWRKLAGASVLGNLADPLIYVLGLGYALAAPWPANLVDAAGQFHDICEVSLPFYDPGKRRPRGGWRDDLLPECGPSFIRPMM